MESIKNRNDAYVSIIRQLPDRRKYIFQMIDNSPNCSSWDIANKTMLPFNQVSARITELKELFLIIETGSKIDAYTKKKNTTYKTVNTINERIDLINAAFIVLSENKSKLESDYHLGISQLTKEMVKKEITKIKLQINALSKIIDCVQNQAPNKRPDDNNRKSN